MNTFLRVLGVVAPIALPLLGTWLQGQFTIFHYPEINVVIPLGFLLVGIVTGALLRSWWSLAYILALGVVMTAWGLARARADPRGDAEAITLAFAIFFVPLVVLGAAAGVVFGKALERRRTPTH